MLPHGRLSEDPEGSRQDAAGQGTSWGMRLAYDQQASKSPPRGFDSSRAPGCRKRHVVEAKRH